MSIVIQEKEILAIFTIIATTITIALCIQTIIYLISQCFKRYNETRWHYISFMCFPVIFVISLHTGLTLYLFIISIGFTLLARVSSWQRNITVFLFCFMFIGIAMIPIIKSLTFEINLENYIWTSHHYGEIALWPSYEMLNPQYLFIYYDSVILTRLACKNENNININNINTIHYNNDNNKNNGKYFTNTLVSFGENTKVYALESCMNEIPNKRPIIIITHQINLLGLNSRLEGVNVRCKYIIKNITNVSYNSNNSNNSNMPCLNLASDIVLVNVNFELYNNNNNNNNNNGKLIFSHMIHFADNCNDVLKQLQHLNKLNDTKIELYLKCFPKLGKSELLQVLNDKQIVPTILKDKLPYSLKYLWHMPGVLQIINNKLNDIVENILSPGLSIVVDKIIYIINFIKLTFSNVMKKLIPYANSKSKDIGVIISGIYCTGVKDIHSSYCNKYIENYNNDKRYLMGVQILNTSYNIIQFILDAVDLIPGFWTAFIYTLHLEWQLTLSSLKYIKFVIIVLFINIIWPFLQAIDFFMHFIISTFIQIIPLLFSAVGLSILSKSIIKSFIFIYYKEMQWLHLESQILFNVISYLYSCSFSIFIFTFHMIGIILTWVQFILGIYTSTSLSAHFFIALVQTILILIAMRNELKDIVTREREKYPKFINKYTGGVYIIMFTTFTRVHSLSIMRYFVAHFVLLFMLIGLSVLRLLSKLYNITLYLMFPCISSYVCLEFFTNTPKRFNIFLISVVKGVCVMIIDCSIGNIISHLLREFFLFLIFLLCTLALLWAWQNNFYNRMIEIYKRLIMEEHLMQVTTYTKDDDIQKSEEEESNNNNNDNNNDNDK